MNDSKGFLVLLIGVLGAVSFLMLKPFLGYFLGALILAFVFRPLHKRMRKRIDERFSAFILVILAVFLAILPLALTAVTVAEDAKDLSQDVGRTDALNITEVEIQVEEYTGQSVELEKNLEEGINRFAQTTVGNISGLLTLLTELTIGLTFMLFLLYYLVKDGEILVSWLRDATPLPEDIQDSLYQNINSTTWAVIKGHILIAIIQGLIAGIGLFIAGVPNYVFWTFVMVLLGFIPIIGTIIVWAPAAAYLFVIGEPNAAIFLALYGAVVVSLTDNILRPIIVDRGTNLHPATILLGVLGGVYLLGASGLFIGPITLGIFKSVLLVYKNNYKDL